MYVMVVILDEWKQSFLFVRMKKVMLNSSADWLYDLSIVWQWGEHCSIDAETHKDWYIQFWIFQLNEFQGQAIFTRSHPVHLKEIFMFYWRMYVECKITWKDLVLDCSSEVTLLCFVYATTECFTGFLPITMWMPEN